MTYLFVIWAKNYSLLGEIPLYRSRHGSCFVCSFALYFYKK